MCTYCRLPIKGTWHLFPGMSDVWVADVYLGLSTTCYLCTHRTHLACSRLQASSSSDPTCSACPCRCISQGGLTSGTTAYAARNPTPTTPPSATSSPYVSYATAASVNAAPISARGPNASSTRTWKVLDMLREQDRAASAASPVQSSIAKEPEHHGHRPSFGAFTTAGTGALGLGFGEVGGSGREGDGEQASRVMPAGANTTERERDSHHTVQGPAGILARARAVMDSGTGWRSTGL